MDNKIDESNNLTPIPDESLSSSSVVNSESPNFTTILSELFHKSDNGKFIGTIKNIDYIILLYDKISTEKDVSELDSGLSIINNIFYNNPQIIITIIPIGNNKLIYESFINCYIYVNSQEINIQITKVKCIIIEILRIISHYIDCPYEIFESIYQKISELTFRRNDSLTPNNESISSDTFIGYLDLLKALYNVKESTEKPLEKMPTNYIINNKTGMTVQSENCQSKIMLAKGFVFVGWFRIINSIQDKSQKKYLFQIETKENSKLEAYFSEDLKKFFLSFKKGKVEMNSEESLDQNFFDTNWIFFNFQIESEKSKIFTSLNLFNFYVFETPLIRCVRLQLEPFKQEVISNITLYKNLVCSFTSIIIGSDFDLHKILVKENIKMLHYGIFKEKQYRLLLSKFQSDTKSNYDILLPYKAIIDNEKKEIQIKGENNIFEGFISSIEPHSLTNNYTFYENNIHLYNKYSSKIYLIGGINTLLPLLEIISTQKDVIKMDSALFQNVFDLITKLVTKSKNNFISAIIHDFFPALSVFMENIPKEYFNSTICKYILEMKKFYLSNLSYIDTFFNKDITKYNVFFEYIFLNERIIFRFENHLITLIIVEIKEMLNDIFRFIIDSKHKNNTDKHNNTQQKVDFKLTYQHVDYILTYEKMMSMLLYYESKAMNKYCCEKHSVIIPKNKTIKREGYLQPELSKSLEQMNVILCLLIKIDYLFQKTEFFQLFKLISLDVTPCLKIFLIKLLPSLMSEAPIKKIDNVIKELKEKNLLIYLNFALGEALISEKINILNTIIALDKENYNNLFVETKFIYPLIKDIIPRIKDEEIMNEECFNESLSSSSFKNSQMFYNYYLQYHRAINLEFYEFPKWISFFYPKHNIIKDDKFFDEIDKLYTTIFDWLVFWVNIVQKEVPTKQECFRAKKNAIFDLLINYVIKIKNFGIIQKHINVFEQYLQQKTNDNLRPVKELTGSKLFWLFIYEIYYHCFYIKNTNNQATLIGEDKWFKAETTIEEVNKTLDDICNKCHNIIQEMVNCIYLTGNDSIYLYYILTWGTYQKILYKSTEQGRKFNDKNVELLSTFMYDIMMLYFNVLKKNGLTLSNFPNGSHTYTVTILNIIYDFVIIFPIGTETILNPQGLFEYQIKTHFYTPSFAVADPIRLKQYTPLLYDITLFLLEFFETNSVFSRDPKIKENQSGDNYELLDAVIQSFIYNHSSGQTCYNRFLFLTKTDNLNTQIKDVTLTYLSIPLVKMLMHFLCFLATINEENNLPYLQLISMFLIDIITISTTHPNYKRPKFLKILPSKEIDKIFEPVILLGFIFLVEQDRNHNTKKEEYSKPLIYLLNFVKKIFTNKNSNTIINSPVYNIFVNILQDADKNSLINLLKIEQNNNIETSFLIKNLDHIWNNFIIHNKLISEKIKDYFNKEETFKHLMRIHCEIKEIIPIINHIDPNDITSNSNADKFKVETNINLAICETTAQLARNTKYEATKTNSTKELYALLQKLERNIILTCKHNQKIYKNIKKELFSWNGMWSNKDIFYNHPENLKQKLLYHLTKEFTTPLLIPILDIDLYLPTFRYFNKANLFLQDLNSNSKYGVSLDTQQMVSSLKKKKDNSSSNNNNFIFKNKLISKIKSIIPKNYAQSAIQDDTKDNACMIKPTHHLPGILTVEENYIMFEYSYYEHGTCIDENNLLYDKENKTCFGSFFKHYNKDKLKSYITIPFSSINMIFKRKYYYYNNSFEIFTNNNKSYYFHVKSRDKRKQIFDKIKERKEFKIVMRNCYKKDDCQLLYINKEYQTRYGFKGLTFSDYIEHWVSNKVSNLEFIMFCNLLAGRSLRDLTQYPVFPWTLTDYTSKELTLNASIFRIFSTPMGMLEVNQDAKTRKELFRNEYEQMEKENEEENLDENNNDNNNNELEKPNFDLVIKDFSIDIKKNLKFEDFQAIPYFYGTHFSNPLYVSHYLSRIFPFSQLRIELQGDNFDPSRLFSSVQSTFTSATSQKTDVRELIPEFFILPEMFININNINLGKSQTNVDLPEWSNNKSYLFVKTMRKSIEYREDNTNGINKWLDLLIGSLRIKNQAKVAGNIYMFHTYASIIQFDEFKSRKGLEQNNLVWIDYFLRLIELGISPQILLTDDIPCKDNKIHKSITFSNDIKISELKLKKLCEFFDTNSFKYISGNIKDKHIYTVTNDDILWIISNILLNVGDDKNITKDKILLKNKNNPYINLQKQNISSQPYHNYPILIKQYTIIQGGFWDGTLLFQNKINNNISILNNKYDNSMITVLTYDKNDRFGFCGTQKGSILVYSIQYTVIPSDSTFLPIKKKENKKEDWIFKTSLNNHTNEITAITINTNLEIMGSTAKDGYVHLYIIPSFKFVRSVKLTTIPYSEFLFISNTPVPCFVLLHESKFVSYTINGNTIDIDESTPYKKQIQKTPNANYKITSYYFFTDYNTYVQYIILGTSNGDIHIREFPEMKLYSYENVFQDYSIDAIIPLTSTNNEFLLYTRCENVKPKYKIMSNPKVCSEHNNIHSFIIN